MVEGVLAKELKIEVSALKGLSGKRLNHVFSNSMGIEPKELRDMVLSMLDELTTKTRMIPMGLYQLNITGFPDNYLFRLDIGYESGFIYPEIFGLDKETREVKYF